MCHLRGCNNQLLCWQVDWVELQTRPPCHLCWLFSEHALWLGPHCQLVSGRGDTTACDDHADYANPVAYFVKALCINEMTSPDWGTLVEGNTTLGELALANRWGVLPNHAMALWWKTCFGDMVFCSLHEQCRMLPCLVHYHSAG